MKITINGQEHVFKQPLNMHGLLSSLQVNPQKVAIEQNLAIVPKSEYEEKHINDGDRIEIIQFMGGG